MRVFPLNRDVIDLLVTAICLSLPVLTFDRPRQLVEAADHVGQLLWDENYSSVTFATGEWLRAPLYEWEPIVDLTSDPTEEQVLQIERSRLLYEEVSCHHEGWDASPARLACMHLSAAIAARLIDVPIVASPDELGVLEYRGLHRAVEQWDRTAGFRPRGTDAAA